MKKWTPVSKSPNDTRTVLLTSASKEMLNDKRIGPAGNLGRIWTGFFANGKLFSENRDKAEYGNCPALFWKDL